MKIRDQTKLRVLVIGAGAVGAYVGASLALCGHPVVFLAKPNSAHKLKQNGLQLSLKTKKEHLTNLKVCTSIKKAIEIHPYDFAIFSLKSYDTLSALKDLKPFREALPPFLCLQNGIENEDLLAAALGSEKVIAGTVTSSISKANGSEIILERLRGMGIAGDHPLAPQLCDALNIAGLNARYFPNADQMKWSKLLTNLLANATSAILDMSPGEIYDHAGLYKIEAAQIRETLAVMAAKEIHAVNLPRTPVRAQVFAFQWLPDMLSRRLLRLVLGKGRGAKMPSLHIDLHSGRKRSEVIFLNGAVVRAGESSGVPTPINAALTQTLSDLVSGYLPIESFQHNPDKFLAHIYSHPAKRML
ncbi:MAG: ketopantoate reductase family protein [Anaerolineales bacterium]